MYVASCLFTWSPGVAVGVLVDLHDVGDDNDGTGNGVGAGLDVGVVVDSGYVGIAVPVGMLVGMPVGMLLPHEVTDTVDAACVCRSWWTCPTPAWRALASSTAGVAAAVLPLPVT